MTLQSYRRATGETSNGGRAVAVVMVDGGVKKRLAYEVDAAGEVAVA